ncbi:DUF523 domain-containing protein [Spirillospora sp. CA-294931]|uniref:DUF523 domain-containing protein n=1 Tax=Spirillospora sp. CA-294931 TaxID=3240042 RepID=UPI003D903B46
MERILVSACLLGSPVRYDGGAKPVADAIWTRWRAEGRLVSVCPEISGGLPVPRPPAEIVGTRILTDAGDDVTEPFHRGARQALDTARRWDVRLAVLKEGSPSCGSGRVYDGTFSGSTVPGRGVTTELLEDAGIRVFSEDELVAAADYLEILERG